MEVEAGNGSWKYELELKKSLHGNSQNYCDRNLEVEVKLILNSGKFQVKKMVS